MESSSGSGEHGPFFLALVGAIAITSGILLWLLTIAASRSHLSGNGWSLSGNGALIVPFGIGPALIAGGWAAIILRLRGHPDWLRLGIGAAGLGVAFVVLSVLSLILGGGSRVGVGASVLFQIVGFLWLLTSPLLAVLVRINRGSVRRPIPWSVAAAVLLPVALLAGCQAGASLLPS